MNRIESNVTTGEVSIIPLTAEELAEAQANTAAEIQMKANQPPSLADQVAALTAQLQSIQAIPVIATDLSAEAAQEQPVKVS